MTSKSLKTYSEEEVAAILSSFRATTSDYLIHTYFRIFKIKSGPLYEKYRTRFNNIIFNNFSAIADRLTMSLFHEVANRTLGESLYSVRYISCIFPNVKNVSQPLLVQYFNKLTGVEHRLLGFTSETQLVATLSGHNLLEKLVGFCGDYCYKDLTSVGGCCGYVGSLRILSPNKMLHLPYSDGFVDRLFDVLLDYLPGDIIKSMQTLGKTIIGLAGQSNFIKELITNYKEWSQSDTHILGSAYVKFVLANCDSLNRYLEPYRCLPKCLGTFFSRVDQRFFLSFMREIYQNVTELKLLDNNAVAYYFYLIQLHDMFKIYDDNNYIPSKSEDFLHSQLDALVKAKQIVPDQPEVAKLLTEIHAVIDETFGRAVKYLEPLLLQFEGFDAHTWVLAQQLNFEQVHASFHALSDKECDGCHDLQLEVDEVNRVISQRPSVLTERLASKWVSILKYCHVSIIESMLEFLLSLPAVCNVVEGLEGGSELAEVELAIKMNLGLVNVEEIGEFEGAKELIESWQIPTLAD